MPCPAPKFTGTNEHDWPLTNWARTYGYTADEYFEPDHRNNNSIPVGKGGKPDGLKQLVNVIARASRENQAVRALGTAWGYEDLARSDAWVVKLQYLSQPLTYVIRRQGGALNNTWRQRHFDPKGDRRLVHVEAGITIGALNNLLRKMKLSMRSLGGMNAQSLAGALSTSTHGGDINEPPLADFVRAIHLVAADGQEFWIERQSDPITDEPELRRVLPCPDTITKYDDELFNAVMVSCGRFGIIYSFVLEVRRAFRVIEVVTRPNRKAVVLALRNGIIENDLFGPVFTLLRNTPIPLGLPEQPMILAGTMPTFFQLICNSQNPDSFWVQRRWETTARGNLGIEDKAEISGEAIVAIGIAALTHAAAIVAGTPIVGPIWATAMDATAIEIGIRMQDRKPTRGLAISSVLTAMWQLPFFGDLIKVFADQVFANRFADAMATGKRGPYDLVTSGTAEASRRLEDLSDYIEVVFDATTPGYLDFYDTVLAAAPGFKQCGYISMRHCLSSSALLSMHNFPSGRAVSIEFTSFKGLPDNAAWMLYLQNQAMVHGGRPHWGQYNKLNDLQVLAAYGPNVMRWREALAGFSGQNTLFSNNFTRQRGLEPTGLVRQVTAVHRTPKGVTTHLCGPIGSAWSPVSVADAIKQIESGIAKYFTQAGNNVAFLEVIDHRFLRTPADATPANNLDQLPLCVV